MVLKGGTVLDENFVFKKCDISVGEKGITFDIQTGDIIDCTDCFVVPGFIDIHTHGAKGFDAMDPSYMAINTLSHFYARGGVTTFLPTIMTQSKTNMMRAAKNIATSLKKGVSGAQIGGIYMEGPYFSVKYKGAQNEKFIRLPSSKEFDEINAESGGIIKIISLAPELAGAAEFIEAEKNNANIAIGHTDANYEEAKTAIDCGASVMTHTFNAMRGFAHREPNAVGAAFDSNIFCECIADGFHLSPTTVRLLYKAVGADRLVLITDSLRATGMADGKYELGGQEITVSQGRAYTPDNHIAGSTAILLDCIKNAVDFGIPLEDAIKAATKNPARAAGIYEITGSISEGKRADIVVLNKDLSIRHVIINGKIFVA